MNNKIQFDAIILGAGPYGLSTAAKLRKRGAKTAVFGKPMALWRDHMPKGMLLRSRWWDTSFSTKEYSIAEYLKYLNMEPYDPLPEAFIIEYGLWFQKNAVPDVDETHIKLIERTTDGFLVTLADGRKLTSKYAVLAPGLGYYTNRPSMYDHISKDFISHTHDNLPYDSLKGKRVIIIGGGQSGLENAALMSEAGIDVHLIHRSPLNWLNPPQENKSLYKKLRMPEAAISDGWDNYLLEHLPYAFHLLPRSVKDNYLKGKGENGPAGSHWLIPRTKNVTFYNNKVSKAEQAGKKVILTLDKGKKVEGDHIILATGYIGDVDRLPMLGDNILKNIQTFRKYPVLKNNFESSIPGLFFTGFTSHISHGPLYRFVAGSHANGKRIAYAITGANLFAFTPSRHFVINSAR